MSYIFQVFLFSIDRYMYLTTYTPSVVLMFCGFSRTCLSYICTLWHCYILLLYCNEDLKKIKEIETEQVLLSIMYWFGKTPFCSLIFLLAHLCCMLIWAFMITLCIASILQLLSRILNFGFLECFDHLQLNLP